MREKKHDDSETLSPLLKRLTDNASRILGENLTGIYLHGSLAFGCFSREVSDVDFLIVVQREPTATVKLTLQNQKNIL